MTHHILLYSDDPGVGGVAQYNHLILLSLVEQGYRVTSVQSKRDTPLVSQQQQRGVHHEWLGFDSITEFGQTVTNADAARSIFSQTQPDLILFSDCCPLSNMAAKQVALQLDIPYLIVIGYVASSFAEYFQEQPQPEVYLQMLSRQYDRAKAVVAVSQENLELLHNRFGLAPDRGQVIHYGRPSRYFAPRNPAVRDRLRRETGILDNATVCFTAARLEPVKGFQYQLDAIVQLQQTPAWSSLYFIWAGEGGLMQWLTEAIEREGIGDRVKLLGQRWDIEEWLDAADIFVLPSESEGMPLAIMEAMAKGLPVVATAVSGIPEELGETGILLPDPVIDSQATIDQLVASLQTLVDPDQRRSLGVAAKQRAEVMFKSDRMVKETLALVEAALPADSEPMPEPPTTSSDPCQFPKQDYVSPNLAQVNPDAAFPHKVVGDPRACPWAYLRRDIPHNWYVDERHPLVGFLSRDEAHILYNNALQFKGKRALEIGCWMGWSACHLALAGVELDVVDPLLEKEDFFTSVRQSLTTAGVLEQVNLVAGYSPQAVEALATSQHRQWSLIFIDGNHDAPAPLQDAIACELLAEADAMILFHDLASPEVTQGLDYLRQRGWQTLIYQTMQVMGVAWRGAVQPVQHQPDPRVHWVLPNHLTYYPVSQLSSAAVVAPSVPPVTVPPINPKPINPKVEAVVSQPVPSPPPSERSWQSALPQETLATLQQAAQTYTYRGIPFRTNPFDLAIYPLLLWDIKPRTILQIGTTEGSTLWLTDLLNSMGIEGQVYTVELGASWQPSTIDRPLLVIVANPTDRAGLEHVHSFLQAGEYLIVEGAIAAQPALKVFLTTHAAEYEIDTHYCDFFGYNVTGNPNGYLKRRAIEPTIAPEAVIAQPVVPDPATEMERSVTAPQEIPPEPLEPTELMEVLGLASIGELQALIQECQQNSEAALAIGQLRRLRQQLAEYWLASLADELPTALLSPMGDAHRLLLSSVLRDQPLTVAEQALQRAAIAYIAEGFAIPGGIQHLLVVMLYSNPASLSFPIVLANIPAWLLGDYLEWAIASPDDSKEWLNQTLVEQWVEQATEAIAQLAPAGQIHLYECLQRLATRLSEEMPDRQATLTPLRDWLTQCQNQRLNGLNLTAVNWIVFPDWQQPEAALFADLLKILRTALTDPDRDRLTLLIDIQTLDPTDADLAISEVLLHLLTEESIELDDTPQIIALPSLDPAQWEVLRSALSLQLQLPTSQPPEFVRPKQVPVRSLD